MWSAPRLKARFSRYGIFRRFVQQAVVSNVRTHRSPSLKNHLQRSLSPQKLLRTRNPRLTILLQFLTIQLDATNLRS